MTILIIEDDADTAALIAEWVKPIASQIILAATMAAGKAEIAKSEKHPHIIILDLKLPDSTVMQTLAEIATIRESAPESFIVILSGAMAFVDPLRVGAHGFIHKTEVRGESEFLKKLGDIAQAVFGPGKPYEHNLCRLEDAAGRICTALK